MKTIMLSSKMPERYGGKPKRIGSIEFDAISGRMGIFLGYDRENGNKVCIPHYLLDKALFKQGVKLTIRTEQTPLRSPNFGFKGLIKSLIPDSIKEELMRDPEQKALFNDLNT